MSGIEGNILGIETAIAGGSLTLFRDGIEAASWTGPSDVSRAEYILPAIDSLLSQQSIRPADLWMVAVSTGPGSFTGIRIGIATVLGLRASLGVRIVGLRALEAMAFSALTGDVLTAVPVGRQFICQQRFCGPESKSEPELLSETEFLEGLRHIDAPTVIVHRSLYRNVKNSGTWPFELVDAGGNIARLICLARNSDFARKELQPLFMDRSRVS